MTIFLEISLKTLLERIQTRPQPSRISFRVHEDVLRESIAQATIEKSHYDLIIDTDMTSLNQELDLIHCHLKQFFRK